MLKQRNEQIQLIAVGLDTMICVLAFFAALIFRFPENFGIGLREGPVLNTTSIAPVIWMLWASLVIHYFVYPWQNFYTSLRLKSLVQVCGMVVQAFLVEFFVLGGLVFFFQAKDTSRKFFLLFLVINYGLILIEKITVRFFLLSLRRRGYNVRHLLVVGTQGPALQIERLFQRHSHWGYLVEKYLRAPGEPVQAVKELPKHKVTGADWTAIEAELMSFPYDEVYIAANQLESNWVIAITEICDKVGVPTRVSIPWIDPSQAKITYISPGGIPVVTYYTTLKTPFQATAKRMLDILISLVGLMVTGLVYPWIAYRIKKESPGGPVVFKQKRFGENGRIFKCYKFRTMHPNAEEMKEELKKQNELSGPVFKLKDDPRIFPFGKFLRQSSLDELPQFLNILRGDMSVVGTRPPTPDEVQLYSLEQRRRLSIRPGLTGMWQVSGRNEVKNFNEILKLDLNYIDDWSLWLDLKIIVKTVWVVFTRKGVS